MKRPLPPTTSSITHISRQLQQLKREIERLSVRLLALQRYRRHIASLINDSEDEESPYEDITATLEALLYDMSTYHQQLLDRHAHITQGYVALQAISDPVSASAFAQYIHDDARLVVKEAQTARDGYNELIENLVESIELND